MMTGIYFGDATRLKTYSATTRSGKSSIRIEIETTDHFDLGHILRQLDEIEAAQKLALNAKATGRKPARQLALPAPSLALPYYREDE